MKRLDHYWGTPNPVALLLLPLSWIFCLIAWLRRLTYRAGLAKTERLPVPVVVIGNISVGGTGKTPLVIWLAQHLGSAGYRPGIISRGYGGKAAEWPQRVTPQSDPGSVGDEPVLIATRTNCPMWVGPDRPAAARALLDETDCDIILSDDGMQHYALGRDMEIAVMDGMRRLGNGFCLPAGPLRERPSRLSEVDLVVCNGPAGSDECAMELIPTTLVGVVNREDRADLSDFSGMQVHAIAGIGNPWRFFEHLRRLGMEVIEHAFPDHHGYRREEIVFSDELPVLMTEKDAVKCSTIADERHWYVEVDAQPDELFRSRLSDLLRGLKDG